MWKKWLWCGALVPYARARALDKFTEWKNRKNVTKKLSAECTVAARNKICSFNAVLCANAIFVAAKPENQQKRAIRALAEKTQSPSEKINNIWSAGEWVVVGPKAYRQLRKTNDRINPGRCEISTSKRVNSVNSGYKYNEKFLSTEFCFFRFQIGRCENTHLWMWYFMECFSS